MFDATAWNHPIFIVAMFVAAIAVAWWLIRAARPREREPSFECSVCGRRAQARVARDWRYCPYCGAPRDAKSLRDMPHRRRSIVDIE